MPFYYKSCTFCPQNLHIQNSIQSFVSIYIIHHDNTWKSFQFILLKHSNSTLLKTNQYRFYNELHKLTISFRLNSPHWSRIMFRSQAWFLDSCQMRTPKHPYNHVKSWNGRRHSHHYSSCTQTGVWCGWRLWAWQTQNQSLGRSSIVPGHPWWMGWGMHQRRLQRHVWLLWTGPYKSSTHLPGIDSITSRKKTHQYSKKKKRYLCQRRSPEVNPSPLMRVKINEPDKRISVCYCDGNREF